MIETIAHAKEREYKDQLIYQSFNAWLQGAGQKKTFGQFIKHLKLDRDYKENLSKEDAKRMAQQNIENAKRIRELDRQQKEKKGG